MDLLNKFIILLLFVNFLHFQIILKEIDIQVSTKFIFKVKLFTSDNCLFFVVKSDKSCA